jgi:cytochrome P450
MITKDGAHWHKLRAVEQPAFCPSMVSSYIPDFLAAINERMEQWRETARAGAGGTIDICEQTWALAAQMTSKALFDRDLPFESHVGFSAVKAFTNVTNHETARLRIAGGELVEMEDSEIAKASETWLSLPRLVLAADAREGREHTLLKMMERAAADAAIPEFDRQQVLDEVRQYIWAGTETTAITLAWALYLTARHPEVAARVRLEGAEIYGDREPKAADYTKLCYSRNVIQETMRIYPPIWSLARTADAADSIGGCNVEPGDTIVLCTYVAHHDPRYWADPDRFDPDRFNAERARSRAPYSYLPFGGGKRACIGGAMSQVENVLALSLLLRDFELEYVGPEPVAINPTVTLAPKDGLPFRIRRRGKVGERHFST